MGSVAAFSYFNRLTTLCLTWDLLSNTFNDVHKRLLPHLAKLPELPFLTPQHLAVWPSSVSSLSEFEPWSHLHVVSNVQSGCDFSCLTHIISLQLQQASNKAVVKLPQGESVALKTLNMNTHCRVGCCLRSDRYTAFRTPVQAWHYAVAHMLAPPSGSFHMWDVF